jgi:hypothetical protein
MVLAETSKAYRGCNVPIGRMNNNDNRALQHSEVEMEDFTTGDSVTSNREARTRLLEEGYRDSEPSNVPISELIAYHLDNLVEYTFNLAGFLVQPGLENLDLYRVTEIDVFACMMFAAARLEETLRHMQATSWGDWCRDVWSLIWTSLQSIKARKVRNGAAAGFIFSIVIVAYLFQLRLCGKGMEEANCPRELVDWTTTLAVPVFDKNLSIDESLKNAVVNLANLIERETC